MQQTLLPVKLPPQLKNLSMLLVLVVLTNGITYALFNLGDKSEIAAANAPPDFKSSESLYLIDHARVFVNDIAAFEQKVRKVSKKLGVAPEWLMAVMYSESKFDASVSNHAGSGATGLIQWMPSTAQEFGITVQRLRNLNHLEQLDYVYKYLNNVRKRYKNYENITDLYLAILYPKAIGETPCYTLYAHPQVSYSMNKILDENKDKRVTVQDIDDRLKRMFPTAYMIAKPKGGLWNWLWS